LLGVPDCTVAEKSTGRLAEVSKMSEAALFEDMVAQRWEGLQRSGLLDHEGRSR
jgi:hypothetical protein